MRIGSLCSGYGGLDLGVQAVLGGTVAWHVEYDAAPSRILAHHWPDIPNHGDLTATDWTSVEPVDILTAGYPCQPFSHAGKRKGTDDPRHLWPHIARAVSVLRPGLVVLENVRGHLSLGFDAVLGDLAALGYDARWGVVRAADAGAPHGRARIFVVAADASGQRHGRGQDGAGVGRLDGPDAGQARERQRPRQEPVDRDAAVAADAGGGPLSRAAESDDGLRIVAERGCGPAADAQDDRRASCQPSGLKPEQPRSARDNRIAADADEFGRGRLTELHPQTPARLDSQHRGHVDGRSDGADWGPYATAIHRWEAITGRPAPQPTEPGRNGPRLSPRFVEFLMGLPAGHVTDVGLTRNEQLKALGNGVVPQQAALALSLLLDDALAGAA